MSHNFASAEALVLVDRALAKTQFEISVDSELPAQPPLPLQSTITIETASGEKLLALNPSGRILSRARTLQIFSCIRRSCISVTRPIRNGAAAFARVARDNPAAAGRGLGLCRRAPRSIIPISVLIAPAVPNAYLSAPVAARDCLEDVLVAMLDHLDTAEHMPSIVALDTMRADTATMQALIRVLERRGSPMRIFTRSMRPMLDSNLDGKAYLEQALSSSSRKKLRQHRRRLAEAPCSRPF